MINVTRAYLPSFEDYNKYIKSIWDRNWLTNNGPLVNELELRLKEYLGLEHLLYLANGTMALQIAIKALELTGEIITTPFSYVATTSSIVWENCKPVFADIDRRTLNIDPRNIEKKINEKTSAILATHVYGNPCDVDRIAELAEKHNLKVIYDAAHCFGTKIGENSVFKYGDISTTSFHATKVFHTIEGGAVVTQDSQLLAKMAWLRNFGHNGPENFYGAGINAKNSEFHAAMGLCNIKAVDEILKDRKRAIEHYKLKIKGLICDFIEINEKSTWNYSYFPIIFPSEEFLLKTLKVLNENLIYPRRYFYPSLDTLNYVESPDNVMDVSRDVACRVACLPLYYGISEEEIDLICRLLLRIQNYLI